MNNKKNISKNNIATEEMFIVNDLSAITDIICGNASEKDLDELSIVAPYKCTKIKVTSDTRTGKTISVE